MFDSAYASVKKMVRKVCQSRGALAVEKALPRLDKDLRSHMLVEAIAGVQRPVLLRGVGSSPGSRQARRLFLCATALVRHLSCPILTRRLPCDRHDTRPVQAGSGRPRHFQ